MTHQPTTAKSHKVLSLTKTRNSDKSAKPRNRTMFQPSFILWTCLCVSLVFICDGLSVADLNLLENGEFHVMTKRVCSKSIGECLTDPEMDSESNRRVLAMQRRYISYETLRRDMVPCDRAGASYYNCRATRANAYNRGCEVITGCARGIKGINT